LARRRISLDSASAYTGAMSSDAKQRFHVEFAGECLDGHAPERVRAGLASLFKADEAALDRLFSGRRQRIKSDCDRATAARYQKAMTGVGARAIIVASAPGTDTDPAAAATEAPAASVAAGDTAQIELAPPGSDVLSPEERQTVTPPEIDLSHLSLAETGSRLAEESAAPPTVEAPQYELGETGARLAPEPSGEAPAPPDISALDLAPEGGDLSDCAAPPPATAPPSTEHLSLAESGSDLLKEEERRKVTAVAPDTSHLSVDTAPEDNPFPNTD
jgi:hypothetical protein